MYKKALKIYIRIYSRWSLSCCSCCSNLDLLSGCSHALGRKGHAWGAFLHKFILIYWWSFWAGFPLNIFPNYHFFLRSPIGNKQNILDLHLFQLIWGVHLGNPSLICGYHKLELSLKFSLSFSLEVFFHITVNSIFPTFCLSSSNTRGRGKFCLEWMCAEIQSHIALWYLCFYR